MKCKKIQELLLSDYLDGELNDDLHNEINIHLSMCPECRQFESALHKKVVEPLKKAKKINPPERVWVHIKEAIVREESEKSEGFLGKLHYYFRRFFSALKAVPTFATVITAVILITMVVMQFQTKNQKVVKVQPSEEQIEYVLYLMGESDFFSARVK